MHSPVNPDSIIHPGMTLAEFLSDKGRTVEWAAGRLRITPKHAELLIDGKVPLGRDLAQRLEEVTRIPERVWMALERGFQDSQSRGHGSGVKPSL